MILLTVLTVVLVLLLVAVLVAGLVTISNTLHDIGGDRVSYMGENMHDHQSGLAKVRWGLRAIERHTAGIEPGVDRVNGLLAATGEGVGRVEDGLDALLEAVERQGARP